MFPDCGDPDYKLSLFRLIVTYQPNLSRFELFGPVRDALDDVAMLKGLRPGKNVGVIESRGKFWRF